MSSTYDGDLIRPLGLVTLNFGYVEAQVNTLMEMLQSHNIVFDVPPAASLGQRLFEFENAVKKLQYAGAVEVLGLLAEAKPLIDERNSLVHASVLAGGRVIPNDPSKAEFSVTSEDLEALAKRAFNWKERLNSAVQRKLIPELKRAPMNVT